MSRILNLKRGIIDRSNLNNPTISYVDMAVIMNSNSAITLNTNIPYNNIEINDVNYLIEKSTGIRQTLNFGTITDSCINEYPCTINNTLNTPKMNKTYRNIYNNFDSFKEFYWDIINYNGVSFYGVKIKSMNDLVDKINSGTTYNGNNRTSPYSISCYAKINPHVAKINKIYGINKFYSVLKGRKNYKRKIGQWGNVYQELNWENKYNFLNKIWEYFTFPGFVTPDNYMNCAQSIWFTNNSNTMYATYKNGHSIQFTDINAKNRYVFDYGSSDFNLHTNTPMVVTDSVIVGLNGKTFTIYKDRISDKNYNNNDSFIKIYKLTGNINGSTIISLLVKPIGMDIFRINYVKNDNNLNLYMIMYNGNGDSKIDIRKLDNVLISGDQKSRMISDFSFMIDKNIWNNMIYPTNNSKHIGITRQKSFRFFISDGYGNISNLSPEIKPFLFMSGAKTRTMIKNI